MVAVDAVGCPCFIVLFSLYSQTNGCANYSFSLVCFGIETSHILESPNCDQRPSQIGVDQVFNHSRIEVFFDRYGNVYIEREIVGGGGWGVGGGGGGGRSGVEEREKEKVLACLQNWNLPYLVFLKLWSASDSNWCGSTFNNDRIEVIFGRSRNIYIYIYI